MKFFLNSSNSKESLTLNIGSYELQQSSILIPSGSIGENTLIVSADLYICLQDFSLEPDLIQQTFQLSSAITQDCVLIWLKFSPGCNNLLERIGFMRFLLLHTSAVSLLMVLFLTTRELKGRQFWVALTTAWLYSYGGPVMVIFSSVFLIYFVWCSIQLILGSLWHHTKTKSWTLDFTQDSNQREIPVFNPLDHWILLRLWTCFVSLPCD